MRKGSVKPKPPESLPIVSAPEPPPGYESPRFIATELIRKEPPEIYDILLRICDACHDMQNESEPWASIRKDIERLR